MLHPESVTHTQNAASSPKVAAHSSVTSMTLTLERLRRGQRARGMTTAVARIESLGRLERSLVRHQDALVRAVDADFGGRSHHETRFLDIWPTLNAIRHACTHVGEWMKAEPRPVNWTFLPSRGELRMQPLGVIGIVSPWNYPIQLALSPLVGAIAAGNAAIIKPSELTYRTSELLATIVAESFDDDHVTVITGGPEVGQAFTQLPLDHLIFTGSTGVGKHVMRAASENLVPVTLELGGKSPVIIGSHANITTTARRLIMGKLINAGQTCVAPDYVLVHESVRDAFVEACKRAVIESYATLEDNPDYTAVVSERHVSRLSGYLEDAVQKGATVVPLHSERPNVASKKLVPTLVLNPTEAMKVMQDEIFGPILPIKTYDVLGEAIAYVNDHARPLALYFFGPDEAEIERVLDETISGGVAINETIIHVAQDDLPFGGVGASGMGAYHAKEGFLAMSKAKPVYHQSRVHTLGLFRPPFGKVVDGMLKVLIDGASSAREVIGKLSR